MYTTQHTSVCLRICSQQLSSMFSTKIFLTIIVWENISPQSFGVDKSNTSEPSSASGKWPWVIIEVLSDLTITSHFWRHQWCDQMFSTLSDELYCHSGFHLTCTSHSYLHPSTLHIQNSKLYPSVIFWLAIHENRSLSPWCLIVLERCYLHSTKAPRPWSIYYQLFAHNPTRNALFRI